MQLAPGSNYAGRFALSQGSINLYQKPVSGMGTEEVFLADGLGKFAGDWARNGESIAYVGGGGIVARSDLWILSLTGARKQYAFLETPFVETQGQFSPDGRWLAYSSNEAAGTWQFEVYVRSFPDGGRKWRVSTEGGGWPRWGPEGKEIVYLARDNTLMAAQVTGNLSGFDVGAVRPLFAVRPRPMVRLDAFPYALSPDGQRVLVNTFVDDTTSTAITLAVNWQAGLKK